MEKKKGKVVCCLETSVECPNCCNFLLEKVELPSELYDDELFGGKRLGYYCPDCESVFSPSNLKDPQ